MVVRMMRKMFVLVLAALGVQYLRMVARVIARELRPQSSPSWSGRAGRTPRASCVTASG